jgi:hypothetical protein
MLIPKPSCRIPPSFPSTFHRIHQIYKVLLFPGATIFSPPGTSSTLEQRISETRKKSVVNGRLRSPKGVR